MSIDEDTGEPISCPFCDRVEYWDCPHLVVEFDRNSDQIQMGKALSREKSFDEIISENFIKHIEAGSNPHFEHPDILEIWNWAKEEFHETKPYVSVDGLILERYIMEELQLSGAVCLDGVPE